MRIAELACAGARPASTLSRSSRRVICEEALAVERVEVHVEAPQPGVVERPGQLRQQHAVGGERQVADAREWRPGARISTGRSRRTSGSPPVTRSLVMPSATAMRTKRSISSKSRISLRSTNCTSRLRHAVEAADVAAVGDADAQVVVDPAEGIDQGRGRPSYFTASMRSSGTQRAPHDLGGQFHARFQVQQAVAQLLQRVELHVRALAAIAVLVGHEVEALARAPACSSE